METGIRTLTENDLSTLSISKQIQFGAVGATADGRQFRYVSFGGVTTIAPGVLVSSPVIGSNQTGLVITAVGTGGQTSANLALGSTQIVLTAGGTAFTADQFAEGFLEINIGGGTATGTYSYRIRGNTAPASSTGTFTVYLAQSDALRNTTALVPGTDTATVQLSPFSGVNITSTANNPVGFTILPAVNTSSVTNYGWVQTHGLVNAIGDGSSIAVGNTVGPSSTTAGFVALAVTTTKPPIGYARATSSTGSGPVSISVNIN